MSYNGKCYCGAITWKVTGQVDFTAVCHCSDCQTVSGSSFGSSSLMIYSADGVEFGGTGTPKVYANKSDAGNSTQRGFCPTCGSILFNHVSEGKPDEHWAMRTGGMENASSITIQKEIYMKSKPSWIPSVTQPSCQFEGMP